MEVFEIEGGSRLEGRLRVNGSKNAALPLMAAALLTDKPVTLRDVPDLADIRNMISLLFTVPAMLALSVQYLANLQNIPCTDA